MILAEGLSRPGTGTVSRTIAWLRARPLLAVLAVIAIWGLMPEVRRLIDWKVGFSSISVISALPLLALAPAAIPLLYGKALRALDGRMLALGWAWLGGFTFSLAVAATTGNITAAVYSYAEFCLPAIFALWVATLDVPIRVLYQRIATFSLWLATPLALYGAFQFAAPPAWDVAWMLSAKITSIGVPLPFQLRPFSTLNSPGIFADFLVAVILLNLPRLRSPKPLMLGQIALCLGVLTVTMVRSNWIALVVGVIVYVVLSPGRAKNLTLLAGVAIVFAILLANVSALLGSAQAGSDLSTRLDTFSNLDSDVSYNERARYWGEPLIAAATQPLGEGLGVIGTAAKLGDSGSTHDFDNGYVARFTEMGYFGTACYVFVLIGGLVLALQRHRKFGRAGMQDLASIAAAVAALQFAWLWLDVSSDHHNQLAGLFFWLSLALIGGRDAAEQARRIDATS